MIENLIALILTSAITVGLIPFMVIRTSSSKYNEMYPESSLRNVRELNPIYDFIVVGGGSTGAVVPSRLSEVSNWSVLLLEAGDNENIISDMPLLMTYNLLTKLDWKYQTMPSMTSAYCLAMVGDRCNWPRGKVLGGSSVLNAMIYVRGNSRNPLIHPDIIPNYFSHKEDMDVLIDGIQIALSVSNTSALQRFGSKPYSVKLPGCQKFSFATNEYWECAIRKFTFTMYRPVGTCKMRPRNDSTAVVDPKLRVYGVKGLRVTDASIMPTIVNGNTNAPVIMIGEKASDIIKEDWRYLKKNTLGLLCDACKKANEHILNYIDRIRNLKQAIIKGEVRKSDKISAMERQRIEAEVLEYFKNSLPSELRLPLKLEDYYYLASSSSTFLRINYEAERDIERAKTLTQGNAVAIRDIITNSSTCNTCGHIKLGHISARCTKERQRVPYSSIAAILPQEDKRSSRINNCSNSSRGSDPNLNSNRIDQRLLLVQNGKQFVIIVKSLVSTDLKSKISITETQQQIASVKSVSIVRNLKKHTEKGSQSDKIKNKDRTVKIESLLLLGHLN
uniref:Glucose-methanol-choline oxidoreductase C-terminal domain-containing protein n=1 Tax=Vespula pensylvanica TaxID=30213 RepID=A0A834UCS0_VESPE|nr:hypothetical protein H0235_004508 [Vespula pensylvanica]